LEGGKPIWIYNGVKWGSEINISKLFFTEAEKPLQITLKIEKGNGEVVFPQYTLLE
jgi:hypothetical protein